MNMQIIMYRQQNWETFAMATYPGKENQHTYAYTTYMKDLPFSNRNKSLSRSTTDSTTGAKSSLRE